MTAAAAEARTAVNPRAVVLPLALAQFIASYAGSNMNVSISAIAADIDTTVRGMQTTITLFTLTMASLMIPGSKLTDIWGRKFCFSWGLAIYGTGAFLALLSQGLGLMIFGYSALEGIGSALMIPPVYILITVVFTDLKTRAKYFGVVSGAAGLGAAAGPLIGGALTTAISWRASFGLQVLVVGYILFLSRKLVDPPRTSPAPKFDLLGAILSALGMFFVVLGILMSGTYGWFVSMKDFTINGKVILPKGGMSPVWLVIGIGAVILALFFWHIHSAERRGREPLLHVRLFQSKLANLGMGTQLIQWLTLQGTFFVVSVFLQEKRHYNAIETGLMLTPATIGILLSAARAERMAQRRPQRWLIVAGFTVTTTGMVLLLALVRPDSAIWTFIPGLLLMGLGVGVMLTSSVNVVQSSFSEQDQGDISGLSRSVSNLGSSLGTALVGSILVVAATGGKQFAISAAAMVVFALIGLLLAVLMPRGSVQAGSHRPAEEPAPKPTVRA